MSTVRQRLCEDLMKGAADWSNITPDSLSGVTDDKEKESRVMRLVNKLVSMGYTIKYRVGTTAATLTLSVRHKDADGKFKSPWAVKDLWSALGNAPEALSFKWVRDQNRTDPSITRFELVIYFPGDFRLSVPEGTSWAPPPDPTLNW